MLTENYQQLSENMRRLNEVGYAIELDDFGAGYSNLAALAELPLDTIKLDMSLVRTLDTKEPVVRHCIELAHDLGLCVVAEGVETQEQLDKLRARWAATRSRATTSHARCLQTSSSPTSRTTRRAA